MANYIVEINELIISPGEKADSFCKYYRAKPQDYKSKDLGDIFGLVEYKDSDEKFLQLTDLLLKKLEDNYYGQTESLEDAKENIEEKFEQALQKTNADFLELLNESSFNVDLEKLNIILVLVKDEDIYLTYAGTTNALLIHQMPDSEFKIIDIFETLKDDKNEQNIDPLKLFSQTLSGKISNNDFLFLSNTIVLDYLSLEKIKKLITLNTPPQALLELKKLLEEINTNDCFALIIFDKKPITTAKSLDDIQKIQASQFEKIASNDSMRELIKTQRSTQKILNTSFLPDMTKYTILFKRSFKQYLSKAKNVKTPKAQSNYQTDQSIKDDGKIRQNSQPRYSVRPKIPSFSNPFKNISFLSYLKNSVRLLVERIKNLLDRLSPRSRLLLIASVILIIIFASNLVYLGFKNSREENEQILGEAILRIQEKNDEAQASLIYEDETKARRLLLEAKELLNDLSKQHKKEQTVKNLSAEIESQLSKLRHLVEINEPVMLANFGNVNPNASIAPILALAGSKIYSQDYNNQAIYKLDPDSKNITTTYQADIKIKNAKAAVTFSSYELIFLNQNQTTFKLDINNDLIQQLDIKLPTNSQINNFDTYNQRLYFLDNKNNQIYRFQETEDGFSGPSEWIKENIDLSDVTSFTIDGQIYLLRNNGQILKLLNGLKSDFEISDIDPRLESPSKITTFIDSNYLYILDPPTKRVVVLDKSGKLVIQYFSPRFDNLKDISVSEASKRIYILNGNQVFVIAANHLE